MRRWRRRCWPARSREVTDRTFNAITVDGECSTNDTFVALASGSSGVAIDEGSYGALVEGLEAVARALALAIVRGGEGATKLVAVHVTGADSAADAMRAAKTIANSPLVKTAIHGADPNWGRLVSASGRSGARFVLEHARVQVGPIVLFKDGQPFDDQAPAAARVPAAGRSSTSTWTSAPAAPATPSCGRATSAPSTCGSTGSIEHESTDVCSNGRARAAAQGGAPDAGRRIRRRRRRARFCRWPT